ncbi:MAG TPA: monovalent cation/H+ antiporter complex subunit F [Solirubrobacterales bacterium]|jgi:multisubunit Na+/H+ antiporter MnhF subunit|nr:monovalent cation/H+ antiporter complex subunit F [Solirubrobacterales bacterium]
MNEWAVAAIVLLAVLPVCAVITALLDPIDGLIALEVSGTTGTAILLLLSESLKRQPFADLALIFAALSFVGALGFARLLERRL